MAEQTNNMQLLPHWNNTKSEVRKFFGLRVKMMAKVIMIEDRVVCNRCVIKISKDTIVSIGMGK